MTFKEKWFLILYSRKSPVCNCKMSYIPTYTLLVQLHAHVLYSINRFQNALLLKGNALLKGNPTNSKKTAPYHFTWEDIIYIYIYCYVHNNMYISCASVLLKQFVNLILELRRQREKEAATTICDDDHTCWPFQTILFLNRNGTR